MNWKQTTASLMLTGSLTLSPLAITGCDALPEDPGTRGAIIGGAGGAAAGGIIADDTLLGALIGGALGAGGGYLIGANWENITGDNQEEAREAAREGQIDPATPQEVFEADTADLNDDGFVTMDEVIAMEDAGLSDEEMIDRLVATDQIFELTPAQEEYLRDQGVDQPVITAMRSINQDQREQLLEQRQEVIGQER
ncbi:MAG: hypothetical protein WDZ31_12745 [Phycisphaeraceae bacterium]